ncbi:hypothetical protein [Streptomyces sp. MMBL 11-3]|uniref:hypothetical protein n=1 Tax=Streptomyces sp. MMBL 11-3 TaxID=3382639 RepID=UPI0039B649C3
MNTAERAGGERVRRALALRERLDALIAQAGVADREDGVTWTEIGTAAGITRQSAQGRRTPHVTAWAVASRRAVRDHHALTALAAAVGLDAAHARHADDDQQDVFSRALDAVRSPGAEAAERARRERAATVRARLAAPAARAEALHQLAALREEAAERHDGLAHLEPDTADTHQAAATQARDRAAQDREFAHLLASQAPDLGRRKCPRFIAGRLAPRDR